MAHRAGRAALMAAAALAACEAPPFREPQRLGGVLVPAEVLNRGFAAYRRACRTCHGDRGDGQGPTGWHLDPPPRDFTLGVYKFAAVPAGSLPRDEDLRRMINEGLDGTAMRPWGLPPAEVDALIQYLKTFSPRWREEEPGEAVVLPPDPWGGQEAQARERGRRVYHVVARCQACHPAYDGADEVAAAAAALHLPAPEPRPHPRRPTLTPSDFGRPLAAPDFTRDVLRSVRPESRLADLARVVAAGVGGTGMPSWQGALPPGDLWALAHYVEALARTRRGAAPRGHAGG